MLDVPQKYCEVPSRFYELGEIFSFVIFFHLFFAGFLQYMKSFNENMLENLKVFAYF